MTATLYLTTLGTPKVRVAGAGETMNNSLFAVELPLACKHNGFRQGDLTNRLVDFTNLYITDLNSVESHFPLSQILFISPFTPSMSRLNRTDLNTIPKHLSAYVPNVIPRNVKLHETRDDILHV